MPQPNNQSQRKLRSRSTRATDLDKFRDLVRALDRTVIDISMKIYEVPQRNRAAILEQHRQVHDMLRESLLRLL